MSNYKATKVSKYFFFDWQYAMDKSSVQFLRPASLIIGLMPLIGVIFKIVFEKDLSLPTSFWSYWLAALFFLTSWGILNIYCPRFIREYRDYGSYSKRKHSHRWVVWEFYNNIKKMPGWEQVIMETYHKNLLKTYTSEYRTICTKHNPKLFENMIPTTVDVFEPINDSRDIFLPININENMYVLTLEEDDLKLESKEKELFWILFTKSAKINPIARVFYWIFFYLFLIVLILNILNNIYKFICLS